MDGENDAAQGGQPSAAEQAAATQADGNPQDAGGGTEINFMVVEKSAVIKFDKHVPSRIFSPDELESLDSYMMKYRKYGIVELLDAKLDGVQVSLAGLEKE